MNRQILCIDRHYIYPLILGLAIVFPGTTVASKSGGNSHAVHWGYEGDAGPAYWGKLSSDTALCGSGKRQSPIDIRNNTAADLYSMTFNYNTMPMQVVNNGHTIQVNYNTTASAGSVFIGGKSYPVKGTPEYLSKLMVGDVPYKLLQFHFHTPSEHARKGERYAMEAHFVHIDASGNLAVVGVFMKRGSHNPLFQKVLDNVSARVNHESIAEGTKINASDLLPGDKTLYHYTGSLTTPPCSENVNWFVMDTPVEVSDEQVRRFAQIIGKNARPLQSMNWRNIYQSN